MKIGIDASSVDRYKGGASFYIVNLVHGLSVIDDKNEYHIFCAKKGKENFCNLGPNFFVHCLAPTNTVFRLLWEQTILPFLLVPKYSLDILHSPNYTMPYWRGKARKIATIFDLSFFTIPHLYPKNRLIFRRIIKNTVRFADTVLTISHSTASDLKTLTGITTEPTVIHIAADKQFKPDTDKKMEKEIKKRFGIHSNYILYTGFIEARKNIPCLIDAFAKLKTEYPEDTHKLVIAGKPNWLYENVFARIKDLNLSNEVIFTGYVPDRLLPQLYRGATIFVFPSLYEGFGIAMLEAICCGVPVIASNNSSIPEVVGEAGLLFNNNNADDLKEKIKTLLMEKSAYQVVKNKCKLQAGRFSWEKTARLTLGAYHKTLKRPVQG